MVRRLMQAGELTLALDFSSQFHLDPALCGALGPEEAAAAFAAEAARYVQLPLAADAIVVVDCPDLVAEADLALREARAVGIDVEWKPARVKGDPVKPSLLQVCYLHSKAAW